MIYTTNSIESLNYQMRKVIKTRGQFPPNDAAVVKLLWLAICNIEDKRAAERAKERGQKRCRTAPPDDSWKDRWSPTGRKHSNSSRWSTQTASSAICKHDNRSFQTDDLHRKLDTLAGWRRSSRPTKIYRLRGTPSAPRGRRTRAAARTTCMSPAAHAARSPHRRSRPRLIAGGAVRLRYEHLDRGAAGLGQDLAAAHRHIRPHP